MKIQCDVCEKAPATVICCADEAALCSKCDIQVHAANKLASKHQRLLLNCLDNKLPPCDICQEKTAFIFCVEDRALFCRDCDEPIHSASSHAANHQRFLATGIRVALSSSCTKEKENTLEDFTPPKNDQRVSAQVHSNKVPSFSSSPWAVDDLLQFSEPEPCDKVQKDQQLEFGELDWFTDMGLFGDQAPAEVPQLPILSQLSNSTKFSMPMNSYRSNKLGTPNKRPRIEVTEDDDEFFTVPDLG